MRKKKKKIDFMSFDPVWKINPEMKRKENNQLNQATYTRHMCQIEYLQISKSDISASD